jgi:hypothetical protein
MAIFSSMLKLEVFNTGRDIIKKKIIIKECRVVQTLLPVLIHLHLSPKLRP